MRYFDLHCDTAYVCYRDNLEFSDIRLAVTPKKAENLDCWQQCFAVFLKDNEENPYEYYKSVLCAFKNQLEKYHINYSFYFTLEGASLIDNAERVNQLKADGIKAITLTWNGENKIAGGVKSDKGLTDFGKEVIKSLNKNKIGCDLSHLNKKSFYGVIENAEYPFASHSNCRALCDNPRNLDDEQIKLIAERQGIIGLCFYPEFLKGNVFEAVYNNIYHLLNMGYENNIAIGSDFDGGIMDKKLDGIDKIPHLYEFLSEKGLNSALLDKIFYSNALKFFDKIVTMV